MTLIVDIIEFVLLFVRKESSFKVEFTEITCEIAIKGVQNALK